MIEYSNVDALLILNAVEGLGLKRKHKLLSIAEPKDLLYCLMIDSCELSVILFYNILRLSKEIPYTCDESLCSLYIAVVPRL